MFEFRSIGRFTTYDRIILAGGLVMAAGTFLPIVRLSLLGSVNYFAGGQGDGKIILVLTAAIVAAVFYSYRRTAALIGAAALVVMIRTLLELLDGLSKFRGVTADNPISALFSMSVGLEWGWIPLIGGALAVIGAGLMSGVATVGREADYDWAQNAYSNVAHYVQETARRTMAPRPLPTTKFRKPPGDEASFWKREIPIWKAVLILTAVALFGLGSFVLASAPSRNTAILESKQERALKPKGTFKECVTCPEMVVVPAGSFIMGSPASEEGHSSDESPQHRVTFATAFAVGKFAVTFSEWDACIEDGACNGYRPADGGWGHGKQPVINVSWDDAKAYVAWLSRKTGKQYRLLSEAEREYVTRAGTTTPFWMGSTISTSRANYDGNYTYGSGSKGEWRKQLVPVDSFLPNPWGFYQVHGNVYEWVEDCYNDDYTGAPTDGSAWTAGDCSRRVTRGGSVGSEPKFLRSADRAAGTTGLRNVVSGFRVARTFASP